ncbi:MAG: hypothetical protein DMF04_10010 [Verrucomicrobia bacterium]|nr:MAG: hypothetical protein DMF04_10010 [Verrucomicrobiota bacterium]
MMCALGESAGLSGANEVCEQEPGNVEYASTYAFSLYLQETEKKELQGVSHFFGIKNWSDRNLPLTTA